MKRAIRSSPGRSRGEVAEPRHLASDRLAHVGRAALPARAPALPDGVDQPRDARNDQASRRRATRPDRYTGTAGLPAGPPPRPAPCSRGARPCPARASAGLAAARSARGSAQHAWDAPARLRRARRRARAAPSGPTARRSHSASRPARCATGITREPLSRCPSARAAAPRRRLQCARGARSTRRASTAPAQAHDSARNSNSLALLRVQHDATPWRGSARARCPAYLSQRRVALARERGFEEALEVGVRELPGEAATPPGVARAGSRPRARARAGTAPRPRSPRAPARPSPRGAHARADRAGAGRRAPRPRARRTAAASTGTSAAPPSARRRARRARRRAPRDPAPRARRMRRRGGSGRRAPRPTPAPHRSFVSRSSSPPRAAGDSKGPALAPRVGSRRATEVGRSGRSDGVSAGPITRGSRL